MGERDKEGNRRVASGHRRVVCLPRQAPPPRSGHSGVVMCCCRLQEEKLSCRSLFLLGLLEGKIFLGSCHPTPCIVATALSTKYFTSLLITQVFTGERGTAWQGRGGEEWEFLGVSGDGRTDSQPASQPASEAVQPQSYWVAVLPCMVRWAVARLLCIDVIAPCLVP